MDIERKAHSIPEFCLRHDISRGTYYNLKKAGKGPRTMHVNGRELISIEAEADWRKACEAASTEPSEAAA
jgi:hypothetical protein